MTIQDVVDRAPAEEAFGVGHEESTVIIVGVDAAAIGGDNSMPSMRAAAYAAGLARSQRSRLVAVWVRPQVSLSDTFVETMDEITHDDDGITASLSKAIEQTAQGFDIDATAIVVHDGDPCAGLIGVAEELGAGTIVVGASSHRLGSVVTRLVRDARWPVTVVP